MRNGNREAELWLDAYEERAKDGDNPAALRWLLDEAIRALPSPPAASGDKLS